MASWIVHLRIAEILLTDIPGLEPGRFAIGNIAPDSGLPDEKWENFSPPLEATHFRLQGEHPYKLADLQFFGCHLLPLRDRTPKDLFSFRLGYFFHLLTDNLWRKNIIESARERWSERLSTDPDFKWEIKDDWYGLDVLYVRDHPESIFWRAFLTAAPANGGLDFLPRDNVRQRVEYIRKFYQRTDEGMHKFTDRPFAYLSPAEVNRFVAESAERIFRIYQYLWVDGAEWDGFSSALELPI